MSLFRDMPLKVWVAIGLLTAAAIVTSPAATGKLAAKGPAVSSPNLVDLDK